MNFKISLVLLIKFFFYMTNTSRQKIEYLENEKSSLDGKKSIFHHFLRAIIEENKKKNWKVTVRFQGIYCKR